MKADAWEWDEQDLLELVRLGVQEGLELDYKQCGALHRSDVKKNEISKDVSAFANSAGGVIVYGMREDGHVPTGLDVGFDANDISKEWLEQVINSRIHRRIDGIRVNQVALRTASPGKVAYVVSIPSSIRAPHQAADKKFYKRFNFESVAMEEYEIRDVAGRSISPQLDLDFAFRPGGESTRLVPGTNALYAPVNIVAVVRNDAEAIADCAVIHMWFDERLTVDSADSSVRSVESTERLVVNKTDVALRKTTVLWDRSKGIPLFKGMSAELPPTPLRLSIPTGPNLFVLKYTIGSPGMATKDELVVLEVADETATLVRPKVATTSRPSGGITGG